MLRIDHKDTIRTVMLTLHPAIRADWLVLQRRGWIAFARIIGAPALLLTCCAVIAWGETLVHTFLRYGEDFED